MDRRLAIFLFDYRRRRITMRTKVRVLVNIFVEERSDESLFQFNRVVPIYYYHAIRAFVKNNKEIKKND